MASFLDREGTVAGPGYSRWLVPPAAIAVQMCIGEIYGFSVFNDVTLYLMAGLLLVGLACNLLVRPVDAKHHHVPAGGGGRS